MFIVSLTYLAELPEIEKHLDAHIGFLDKYYSTEIFIASGRKVPRTGGVILVNDMKKSDLELILSEDPFYRHELAAYDIIEFLPTRVGKAFEALKHFES